ncbi:DUF4214 domain-containing protein [Pseudomaricurvus alkylphenolicus]|uniref:DUF4214 domain-containing protein n=1 Tax=Pseudomaricurvus alkylphenolicus TaxID=1306991 RepID=UPI001420A1AC|nr:DUF4214 domain-containing protein [Pseudomaricurvus alkylphenolicus]NIB42966.1 DUF4214 domain-containing protein [Pseudomaricurvus alkylphenolicus]
MTDNTAPYLAGILADQIVAPGISSSFELPEGLFVDPDGDELTFSLEMQDSTDLLSWLSIDSQTGAITAAPGDYDHGELAIKIIATDTSGSSAVSFSNIRVAFPDVRVNSYIDDDQFEHEVAPLADGGWIVTWHSDKQLGGWGEEVYAQRYDADGNAVGSEFLVNTFTFSHQQAPAVVGLPDGGWVVTWESWSQDGNYNGIFARRYDRDGNRIGSEFQVNTHTDDSQYYPAVAALKDGGWVVTWSSWFQDGSDNGIYVQGYDSDGNAVGAEVQVNTYTDDRQYQPVVTALADGGWLVAWNSYQQDGSGSGVYAQRYDGDGNSVGSEFRVNTYTYSSQSSPKIAVLADGGWLLSWNSYQQDGSRGGVFAQRYDSDGNSVGSEFQVNTFSLGSQSVRAVEPLADGGWLVIWASYALTGSGSDVYVKRYDSNGNSVGSEFRLNVDSRHYESGHWESSLRIATLADGGWVVTWTVNDEDGSGYDIYAQRYDADGYQLGISHQFISVSGSSTEGELLTAEIDGIQEPYGYEQLSYQWFADGMAIDGETSSTLLLAQSHVNKSISVTVAYTTGLGEEKQLTAGTADAVSNVNDDPIGGDEIIGAARQGAVLQYSHNIEDEDGLGELHFQWLRDSDPVEGATADAYQLTQDDVGSVFSLQVSYVDGFGAAESVISDNTDIVENVNDEPTGAVTIVGTAEEDQILTASNSLVDADGLGVVSYHWYADDLAIDGATGDQLILGQDQVGKAISVAALYIDDWGTQESVFSESTGIVVNVNDELTGTVDIVGTVEEYQTLTASNTLADEDGLGVVTYQWYADSLAIDGATSDQLTLGRDQVGKTISVAARYTDDWGTDEFVFSESTSIVVNVNDAPTGAVTIVGTAEEDQTLTVSNTLVDKDGLGVVSYQWYANSLVIEGATSDRLTLEQTQVGKTLSVVARYTDMRGTQESVFSESTGIVVNVNDEPLGTVTIIGTAEEDQTLTVSSTLADEDGLEALSYQWYADGLAIEGATSDQLTLGQDQVGKAINVAAYYTDDWGTAESVASENTSIVDNLNDEPLGVVTIVGTAEEDQILTVSNTLSDEDGLGVVSYQWYADSVAIDGATSDRLTLEQDLVGKSITVTARYTDGFDVEEAVTTTVDSLVANLNDDPQGSVLIRGVVRVGQTVSVEVDLEDPDGLGSFIYKWLRDGTEIAGAFVQEYQLQQDDVESKLQAVVSYTDGYGVEESVTSDALLVGAEVFGGDIDDILSGTLADDEISGGNGFDVMTARYLPSQYILSDGILSGSEGDDHLDSIESIGFGYGMGHDAYIVDVELDDLVDPDGEVGTQKTYAAELLDKISDLYIAYFGRAPAAEGLTYWFKENYTGSLDFLSTAKSFADQTEFRTTYPEGSTNREFVESVYQNMFNRAPEAAGWDYWEKELNNGMDKAVFLLAVINAAYSPTGGEQDRQLLSNKHDVSIYYAEQTMLYPDEGFDNSINELLSAVTSDVDSVNRAIDIIDYVFEEEVTLAGVIDDQALWDSFWVA